MVAFAHVITHVSVTCIWPYAAVLRSFVCAPGFELRVFCWTLRSLTMLYYYDSRRCSGYGLPQALLLY